MNNQISQSNKKPFIVSAIFLSITLIVLILPAFYSRFLADDYCLSAISKTTPFWPYLSSVYNTWTGKFSYIGVLYFLGNLPPSSLGLILSLVCLIWIILLAGLFYQVIRFLIGSRQYLISFFLATILLVSLFYSIPNRFQNLYWLNGLAAYTVPMVFFTGTVNLALRQFDQKLFRKWYFIPLVVLCFISCGFSEGPLIAVIVFYGALFLINLFTNKGSSRPQVATSLGLLFATGLSAFAVQYFSPGTSVRASILSTRLPFIDSLVFTIRNVAHLYGKLLVFSPHWVFLSFLGSVLIGVYLFNINSKPTLPDQQTKQAWLMGFGVNFLIGLGVCGAVVYFMQAYPDDRIIYVPYFFAYFTIVILGILTGLWIGSKYFMSANRLKVFLNRAPYILVLVSLIIVLSAILNFSRSQPGLADYAQRWDERDAFIRSELAAGKRDLIIPGLESRQGLPDLQYDKGDWVNNCTAGYYGASSITGR